MAEQVEGSFAFTALDEQDNFYFVKGDNPLCILHFPKFGFYIYASTEEILGKALKRLGIPLRLSEEVEMFCGDILCIDRNGEITRSEFVWDSLYQGWYLCHSYSLFAPSGAKTVTAEEAYLEDLKSVASYYGYMPEDIDALLEKGFHPEELEELFYGGEL